MLINNHYQFDIENSIRIWLFVPYLITCLIVSLPFVHLHRLMSFQKKRIIEHNNAEIENNIQLDSTKISKKGTVLDTKKLFNSIDTIHKVQSFHNTIPEWPAKSNQLLLPNFSILISSLTIFYKVITLFKSIT